MHRQLGREGALVAVPKAAARDTFAAGAEPVAEVRDRAGPERDIDVRVELEDPLALRLGVAAADGDTVSGPLRLRFAAFPMCAAKRVSGFSRIVQVLKTRRRPRRARRLAEPELLEQPLIRSES